MSIDINHQTNTISASSGIITISNLVLPVIVTPINVSPTEGTTNVTATPTLTGSTFNDLNGYPMTHSQWQVSTVSDFSTTVVNTGDVAGTSLSYSVPSGNITSTSTVHYWRVRYKSSLGTYSSWSAATSFTTQSSFPPTTIGQSYAGGYYAGKIVDAGVTYYLVISPKSYSSAAGIKYQTSLSSAPAQTQTLTNGPSASASMNSATYPAAQHCEGLTIGGYSDWYLPARDELEVCYRNLKPTTGNNVDYGSRISALGTGFGSDGNGNGYNSNSVPTGSAYTGGTNTNPPQTTVTLFQTGNSESFNSGYYWSSTEFNSGRGWSQHFGNSAQSNEWKDTFTNTARAMRRVAV